jgi:hypothetical protein
LYTGSVSPFYPLLSQKPTLREGKIYLPYLRFEDTKDLILEASLPKPDRVFRTRFIILRLGRFFELGLTSPLSSRDKVIAYPPQVVVSRQ